MSADYEPFTIPFRGPLPQVPMFGPTYALIFHPNGAVRSHMVDANWRYYPADFESWNRDYFAGAAASRDCSQL